MKNPVSHWLHQRLTALMMVFLLPWFLYTFIFSFSYHNSIQPIKSKVNIFLLFILLIIALYHMVLGLLTIIDDYVPSEKLNRLLKICIYLKAFLLGLFGSILLIILAQRSL
jgi:succinate dehydrogenase / fumarate reductase membrane anchor subunit